METQKLYEKIKIPTHSDPRGDLSVLEIAQMVDWPVKRIYYVTNTKLPRGGHCVRGEKKFYIMCQGHCKGRIFDGVNWHEETLDGPTDAILLKENMWREFVDFSEGAVMVAVSNMAYEKDKYILDIEEYKKYLADNPLPV